MTPPKISLVFPPGWDSVTPPLGISNLKAFLNQNGFDVTCSDFSIDLGGRFFEGDRKELDSCVEKILDQEPDVVGLALLDPNFRYSMHIAEGVKEQSKDTKIIVGGPQVSYIGDEILKNYDSVDIALSGEGELGLLNILNNGWQVNTLKSSRTVLESPWVRDLKELPFPDFDDFDLEKYNPAMLPLYTNRGCTEKCTFCGLIGNEVFGPYRERSPSQVIDEVERDIEKYGATNYLITDPLVNANTRYLEKICDLITKSGVEIKWGAEAHPNIEKKTLEKMYKSGCRFLWLSPETGCPTTVPIMGKRVNLEGAKETIKEAANIGIFVSSWFIIGFPGETDKEIKDTIDFAKEIKDYSDELLFVPFTLMKGSYMYDNPKEFGITDISREDCSIWSTFDTKDSLSELEAVWLTLSLWEDFNDLELTYPFLDDYSEEEIQYISENLSPDQRGAFEDYMEKTKRKKRYSYSEIFKDVFGSS